MSDKMVKATLVKSLIGQKKGTKRTIEALGLRKLNFSKEFRDTPEVRGMFFKVKHMVRIEEI